MTGGGEGGAWRAPPAVLALNAACQRSMRYGGELSDVRDLIPSGGIGGGGHDAKMTVMGASRTGSGGKRAVTTCYGRCGGKWSSGAAPRRWALCWALSLAAACFCLM
ncbi:hypothetical protein FGB62_150g00 [Gracilaria domingensis]|nr:hypothetical protein FGB62_150g00 [Gracilaria domingensis]